MAQTIGIGFLRGSPPIRGRARGGGCVIINGAAALSCFIGRRVIDQRR